MSEYILEIKNIVLEIFKNKKTGYFVDIGAYDGVAISNTKFLEDTITSEKRYEFIVHSKLK